MTGEPSGGDRYLDFLLDRVADLSGTQRSDLVGPSRERRFAEPRQAFYAAAAGNGITHKRIAAAVGRELSTVSYGVQAARARAGVDDEWSGFLARIPSYEAWWAVERGSFHGADASGHLLRLAERLEDEARSLRELASDLVETRQERTP